MGKASDKKIVVITDASGAIGRACALHFARAGGYRLVLTAAADAEALFDTLDEVQAILPQEDVMTLLCDVKNPMTVKLLFANVKQRFGGVDILINNTGISCFGPLQSMSDRDFEEVVQTNLAGAFHMLRGAIPQMLEKNGGSILLLSALCGEEGAAQEAVYAATKAGIDALTRSVAKELADTKVRVMAVSPSFFDTDVNDRLTEEDLEQLIKSLPTRSKTTMAEIAEHIFDITTSDSTKNGTILPLGRLQQN